MSVAAVVLAAGASTRFGGQKLLAPVAGKPVVRWTVEQAIAWGIDEVIVVLGRDADAVRGALSGLAVRCVENERYAEGLSTSLQSGIAALPRSTGRALVVLGDQPVLPPGVYDRLVQRQRATGLPIIAAEYQGVRGHPVLFDASIFPELLRTSGDEGARSVIAHDLARVAGVELGVPGPPDVDEPEDLAPVARELESREAPPLQAPSHSAAAVHGETPGARARKDRRGHR